MSQGLVAGSYEVPTTDSMRSQYKHPQDPIDSIAKPSMPVQPPPTPPHRTSKSSLAAVNPAPSDEYILPAVVRSPRPLSGLQAMYDEISVPVSFEQAGTIAAQNDEVNHIADMPPAPPRRHSKTSTVNVASVEEILGFNDPRLGFDEVLPPLAPPRQNTLGQGDQMAFDQARRLQLAEHFKHSAHAPSPQASPTITPNMKLRNNTPRGMGEAGTVLGNGQSYAPQGTTRHMSISCD